VLHADEPVAVGTNSRKARLVRLAEGLMTEAIVTGAAVSHGDTEAISERNLRASIVETQGELLGVHEAWSSLHRTSSNVSVFLSWNWLATWWDVFREPDWRLFVVLFHDAQRLVGIAPLWLRDEVTPTGRARNLRMLGTGEPEWEEVVSTQLDVIAAPGYEQVVGRSLWAELRRRHERWDTLIFENLLASSVLATHFAHAVRSSKDATLVCEESGFDYFVDLPSSWQAYVETLRPSFRDNLKRNRRRLEKLGQLSCKVVWSETEIATALRELKRLHEMRQTVKRRAGAFQSERFLRFHERLIALGLKDNTAELGLLAINDCNVAGWLSYRFKGRVSAYISGFDAKERRVHSLGLTNNAYRLERAISEGARVFDFLRAAPGSYKLDYGCQTDPMCSLRVFSATWAGKRSWLLYFAIRKLKDFWRILARSAGERRAW
jgi:CelD/BcsL family acetyltransferase involved in cellulose biosynthesis